MRKRVLKITGRPFMRFRMDIFSSYALFVSCLLVRRVCWRSLLLLVAVSGLHVESAISAPLEVELTLYNNRPPLVEFNRKYMRIVGRGRIVIDDSAALPNGFIPYNSPALIAFEINYDDGVNRHLFNKANDSYPLTGNYGIRLDETGYPSRFDSPEFSTSNSNRWLDHNDQNKTHVFTSTTPYITLWVEDGFDDIFVESPFNYASLNLQKGGVTTLNLAERSSIPVAIRRIAGEWEFNIGFGGAISKGYLVIGDRVKLINSKPADTPSDPNAQISYVALGDSYSSGEGLWPYESTLSGGFINPLDSFFGCHRSIRAYPNYIQTLNTLLSLNKPIRPKFNFYACSGAITDNVRSAGTPQQPEPTQLSPKNDIGTQTQLVTITIGGNDAQFLKLLLLCFATSNCNEVIPFQKGLKLTLTELAPMLISYVEEKVSAVHAELKRTAPNATILVIGYPMVVSGIECSAAQIGSSSKLYLSSEEQAFMRETNRLLNEAIQRAAARNGLHFVPVDEHFRGHEVCGQKNDWINGFVPHNLKGSFHPTGRGHLEYSVAVAKYLLGIQSGWPAGYQSNGLPKNPLPSNAIQTPLMDLTTLPQLEELHITVSNVPGICENANAAVAPGEAILISADNFAPNEIADLKFTVNDQKYLETKVQADAAGFINASIQLPATIPSSGVAHIELQGRGRNDSGVMAFSLINIVATKSIDSDADGLPDVCDSDPGQLLPTSFASNNLSIPVVEAGSQYYAVQMTRTASPGFEFVVTQAVKLVNPFIFDSAWFDGSVLDIPSVTVNGNRYRASLRLVSSTPLTFKLEQAEVLKSSP